MAGSGADACTGGFAQTRKTLENQESPVKPRQKPENPVRLNPETPEKHRQKAANRASPASPSNPGNPVKPRPNPATRLRKYDDVVGALAAAAREAGGVVQLACQGIEPIEKPIENPIDKPIEKPI